MNIKVINNGVTDGCAKISVAITRCHNCEEIARVEILAVLRSLNEIHPTHLWTRLKRFSSQNWRSTMTKSKMVMCGNCLQWFCYNPSNPWGIEVKRRGYSSRYYCGECVAACKISSKARIKEYEHT